MNPATGPCMCHEARWHPLEVEDVEPTVRQVFDDRVIFSATSGEIAPGIEVHHLGGHTAGRQVVRVAAPYAEILFGLDSCSRDASGPQRAILCDIVRKLCRGRRERCRRAAIDDAFGDSG